MYHTHTHILKCLFVCCVCSHKHATVQMEVRGHLWESDFFFYHVCPRDQTQVIGLVADAFTHWGVMLSLSPLFVCWLHTWLLSNPEESLTCMPAAQIISLYWLNRWCLSLVKSDDGPLNNKLWHPSLKCPAQSGKTFAVTSDLMSSCLDSEAFPTIPHTECWTQSNPSEENRDKGASYLHLAWIYLTPAPRTTKNINNNMYRHNLACLLFKKYFEPGVGGECL